MITRVEQAKQILRDNGYYVDNLWRVEDVQDRFNCTEEDAQEVLDDALNGEWIMEQIHYAIREVAEENGHELKDEE